MMRHARVHRVGIVTLVGVLVPSVASSSWPTQSEPYRPPRVEAHPPSTGTGSCPQTSGATVVAAFGSAVVRGNETGLVWEHASMR